MARRTVELGAVMVEGLRLSSSKLGHQDTHLVLFRIDGKAVELPVSPALLPVVKELYGERAKLALVVDDFDPGVGSWKETSRKFFQPDEQTGPRAKPEEKAEPSPAPGPRDKPRAKDKPMAKDRRQRKKQTASPQSELDADWRLLQQALDAVGGVKAKVGPEAGHGTSCYHNVRYKLDAGRTMTDKIRKSLQALVARKGAKP